MTECLQASATAIRELLNQAACRLAHLPTGRLDAELLLGHVLGCDRVALIRDRDRPVEPSQYSRFGNLVEARADGQPLAQLRGSQEFWSLDLRVNQHVLVPRSETELLVSTALELVPRSRACLIADLGTGSGAVALAVASELPLATVIAIDRSAAALDVARVNRARCNLANVRLMQGDWLAAVQHDSLDVILANPPYVAANDPLLVNSSLRYEPLVALAAGPAGLDALTAVASQSPHALREGGWLLMEHGADQAAAVSALFAAGRFSAIATLRDLAGLDRVTIGQKRGTACG